TTIPRPTGCPLFPYTTLFRSWMKRAEGKAVVDYAFHMIVRELTDQVAGDMDRLVKHEGITSFKLFMAYPGVFMVDDATIFKALRSEEHTSELQSRGHLVCRLL